MNARQSLALLAIAALLPLVAEAQSAADRFAAADTDADGALSRAEYLTARSAMFPTLDADADGALSRAEFGAAAPPQAPGMLVSRQFKAADTDKSGALSPAEFSASPTPAIDRADANKDGQISSRERKALNL